MIKYYFNDERGLIKEIPEFRKGCWIDVFDNPQDNEMDEIIRLSGLPEEMLKAPLDEEESVRCEMDDGNNLYIFDIPVIESDEGGDLFYTTLPIGILFNENCIVTICLKKNVVLKDFARGRVKGIDTEKPINFILNFLYCNSQKFLSYLKQLEKSSKRVQNELNKSMKNKELIDLLDIEKSLVYFSTSLSSNQRLIDRMEKINQIRQNEDYQDLYEDVVIESRQAMEMCSTYRDILNGTMDAFASVISNNLNVVMKLLTIITIVLSVPTLIFSLFGMNVRLPFAGNKYGFYIIIGIALVLAGVISYLLIINTKNEGRKEKIRKSKRKKD